MQGAWASLLLVIAGIVVASTAEISRHTQPYSEHTLMLRTISSSLHSCSDPRKRKHESLLAKVYMDRLLGRNGLEPLRLPEASSGG